MSKLTILLIFLFFSSFNCYSKNLTGKIGLGFTSRQMSTTPALSMKFGLSNNTSAEAAVGIESGGSSDSLTIGGRFFRHAYQQDNINFLLGISAFLMREEVNGAIETGFEASGLFGAEFFFDKIEPLGFMILAGIGIESRSNTITFATSGDSFITAGVHYYF